MGGTVDKILGGGPVGGLSTAENERQQRLAGSLALQSANLGLDQQAIVNQLLTGGDFRPILNDPRLRPNLREQPTGPLFSLATQGLQGELDLSQQRQGIAQQLLQQGQASLDPTNQFALGALSGGGASQQAQLGLLGSTLAGTPGIQGLGGQLTGGLSDFFTSGGAPSDAQREQIGNIFDAQRDIGQSNNLQQFEEALRIAGDRISQRGLRANDTPGQELLGRTVDEFTRNQANLESSLSGQQAQALLNQPFQQAQLGGQLQGQQSNQLLNLVNAFSAPITQGFNANQSLIGQREFGAQFSPFAASGTPINLLQAGIGGARINQATPTFSQSGVPNQPGFFGSLGTSAGQSAGQQIVTGFGGAIGGGSAGE